MPSRDNLQEFAAWCANHITGDATFRSGTAARSFCKHRLLGVRVGRGLDVDSAHH